MSAPKLAGHGVILGKSGFYRQPFVEVMSALEIVIARRLASTGKVVNSATQSLMDRDWQKAQVAVMLLATGATNAEIESTLSAHAVRNQVAHEGYQPTFAESEALRAVIQTIKRLGGNDEINSPLLTATNRLSPGG